MQPRRKPLIVFRLDERVCALPVEAVSETHRPLPFEPLPDTPAWVRGVSLLRGLLTPVIDMGLLLSGTMLERPRRAISVKTAQGRHADLLVSDVVGLRAGEAFLAESIPPLLSGCSSRLIAEIGRLDDALLSVLKVGSVLPEEVWAKLEGARG